MSMFGLDKVEKFRITELINEVLDKKNPKKKKSTEETTTKQQLLILHYSGYLKNLDMETTKKAKLLSVLLNRDYENIRKVLTYIDAKKIQDSNIKTMDNLNAILPVFEDVGLTEEVAKIKVDISKLKID